MSLWTLVGDTCSRPLRYSCQTCGLVFDPDFDIYKVTTPVTLVRIDLIDDKMSLTMAWILEYECKGGKIRRSLSGFASHLISYSLLLQAPSSSSASPSSIDCANGKPQQRAHRLAHCADPSSAPTTSPSIAHGAPARPPARRRRPRPAPQPSASPTSTPTTSPSAWPHVRAHLTGSALDPPAGPTSTRQTRPAPARSASPTSPSGAHPVALTRCDLDAADGQRPPRLEGDCILIGRHGASG